MGPLCMDELVDPGSERVWEQGSDRSMPVGGVPCLCDWPPCCPCQF